MQLYARCNVSLTVEWLKQIAVIFSFQAIIRLLQQIMI